MKVLVMVNPDLSPEKEIHHFDGFVESTGVDLVRVCQSEAMRDAEVDQLIREGHDPSIVCDAIWE
jgi:hypothetical protein